jgi:hypothetical protein
VSELVELNLSDFVIKFVSVVFDRVDLNCSFVSAVYLSLALALQLCLCVHVFKCAYSEECSMSVGYIAVDIV